MAQLSQTILLRGGLDLVTPPSAVPPGKATAAINYEPEVAGYRRLGGYERYNGLPAPSEGADAAAVAARRAAISAVPGTGPVRGVWVYDGHVYAFRDTLSGAGGMYRDSALGWVQQTFGILLAFNTGTSEIFEGDTLAGATSTATATVERVVLQSGAWSGTAAGYIVVSNVSGTFQAEVITSDSGGSATTTGPSAIAISAGGRYNFANHNFYGPNKNLRMYFVNGVGTGFEWDGRRPFLAPIRSGTTEGVLDVIVQLLHRGGDNILARNGDRIIMRGEFDRPDFIGQYRNHLFLGYDVGSILNSGVGEPHDFRAIAGAGQFGFGGTITGFLTAASTSFVVFGESRVEYITGHDSSDFVMSPISDGSGAVAYTAQMSGESPVYLDEAGVRRMTTTAAFGDWRMGTLTQSVEPLIRKKRETGVEAIASLNVRKKDQYRLFYEDRSGIIVYFGRRDPEVLPFLLSIDVFCACAGEIDPAYGERIFVGAEDGFVYELDKGTSFDGSEIQAFIRLPWNNLQAPNQEKRFHKATFEIDAPTAIDDIGLAFHVDYAIPGNPGGDRSNYDVAQGSQSLIPIDDYDNITWSTPVQGLLEGWIDGIGRNMAATLVSETTDEQPHTLTTMTVNFSYRRFIR